MPSQPSLPCHWLFVPCCAGSTFAKLSYLTFLLAFCAIISLWISHKFPLLLSISSISTSLLINLDFFFFFWLKSHVSTSSISLPRKLLLPFLLFALVGFSASWIFFFFFFKLFCLSSRSPLLLCWHAYCNCLSISPVARNLPRVSVSNGPKSDLWSPVEIVAGVSVTQLNLK